MRKRLPQSEWMVVWLLAGGMLALAMLTWIRGDKTPESTISPHHLISHEIEVRIEGAVEKPGLYTLQRGAALSAALELAKPLPDANMQKFKLQQPLRDGQHIKVPTIKGKKSGSRNQNSEMPNVTLLK